MPKRKATWALLIWTVLMAIWIISGIASNSGNATNCGALDQNTCNAAQGIGTSIGVAFIFIIWFFGFIVLGLVALLTRPPRRVCPSCGHEAKKGVTACKTCGFAFATGQLPGAVPPPTPA